ncbi:Lipoxygenase [Dothidotthia symphoricarpi CBS 119687]|uniref:Manganese lipoxygenase n=1 Tax=Dothidotthia symphoricarpi CBS 119687 TaxID=1392245 RepID=A0A6A6AAV6_9PLEO|nr:Lipoxygenase [Dothidotthia symphoricarpi CBS 119687]KAF2128706.1 Lipoxygenase [Dothidotthia symphoricarpi CBS 119687]
MSVATQLPPGAVPKLDAILNSKIKFDVEDDPMSVWDKGVFLNELLRQGIVLSTDDDGSLDGGITAKNGLKKGTYTGTQTALTALYSIIEGSAAAHFHSKGFEPIFPMERDLELKQKIYMWSDGTDGYPPHLLALPPDQKENAPGVGTIFNLGVKDFLETVSTAFSFLVPGSITHDETPYAGPTLADCEKFNREHPSPRTDIMEGRNLGDEADWYSDARFAQQHLSGVNPCTIKTAPAEKVEEYIDEAGRQGLEDMRKLLSEGKDLLIQDYSYFREATGLSNEQTFQNVIPEMDENRKPTGKMVMRYACASVVVFQLGSDGRLHPLAITVDYKGGLDKSITIFNRRLSLDEKPDVDEKDDWPWRYAKTCAQTADWARHEIATHLVDTHLVEEAIIVATNRTIPEKHLLYEVLSPHWYRTLALNSAARKTLVPAVIARISGLGPSINPVTSRAMTMINWSYKNFNFQDKYIPNDLKKRGFDLEAETPNKYRNYPYATDMHLLWGVIREFVKSVLGTKYKSDRDVQADHCISDWYKEIQTSGQLTSFPTITTVDQLIDAVTMCIHTASPQHTAVNYLQDYYYSFVPSKPPALCAPLPKDLKTLQAYTEKDLTAALPIGTDGPKWKDWLLAAQMPELLSFKVEGDYNLITYAKSIYNVNKNRTNSENTAFASEAIKDAARRFYSHLKELQEIFKLVSANQTDGTIEYKVLQPEYTAVSILI